MNATTKHLHTLPFWDHLSDAEKDILRNNAYIRSFDRDSYILHSKAGEDIGLMMLIKGSVRAYLLSPDGRETTLFFSSRSKYLYILCSESVQPNILSGVSCIRLLQ